MNYEYFHDAQTKTVYRLPDIPDVVEKVDRSGRNAVSWKVSAEIDITRADNILTDNNWEYPVYDLFEQVILNHGYNKERAIFFFRRSHYPKCEKISEAEYHEFQKAYQKQAMSNCKK